MAFLELKNVNAAYDAEPILKDVSFSLEKGRILGLVGESGSGKSTIARVITGLLPADGRVCLEGVQIAGTGENGRQCIRKRTKEVCRRVQMVFQNPEGSLNPKHTIGRILCDCITYHGLSDRTGAKAQAQALIERLGLPQDSLSRYPASFSGGQKQRIALARAICVNPGLLIADEPTSALDVSVQRSMLELMRDLCKERELTMLFITHDLGIVRFLCDDVVVLRKGQVQECTETHQFFRGPASDYGRQLLDAVPVIYF